MFVCRFFFFFLVSFFFCSVLAFKGMLFVRVKAFKGKILGSLDIFSVWSSWYVVEYVANDFTYFLHTDFFFLLSNNPVRVCVYVCAVLWFVAAYRLNSFSCTTLSVKVFQQQQHQQLFLNDLHIWKSQPLNRETRVTLFTLVECLILLHSIHSTYSFCSFSSCFCCFVLFFTSFQHKPYLCLATLIVVGVLFNLVLG